MKQRIENILERIKNAALKSGRSPDSVRLVAVSKTMPADTVRRAIDAGLDVFGENYIQEFREKYKTLSAYPVSWHFIGKLQTNKAKYAVRLFDLIHSVDSVRLAEALNDRAKKIDKTQNVLIQVNISGESTKSGTTEAGAEELVRAAGALPNLSVCGLMAMPPFFNDPENARPYFRALRRIRDRIAGESIPNVAMRELSMGMTGDFEAAIEEGATLVRIGTAIFGSRS